MSLSEVITILIWFHMSGYRTFKQYYEDYVQQHLRSEFPELWSYTRFVEWIPRSVDVLILYLLSKRGSVTGISFVDSTSLAVCRNQRILQHKVFRGLADRGKTSMGWFYGFKLHIIINDRGEIISFSITPGNVDDRKPVSNMAKGLFGKLFGDKGYISRKLTEALLAMGVQLVTPLRKNMKPQLLPWMDHILLRKRALIESVNDQLKNISQIEHSRHRSVINFFVNLFAGLTAYSLRPKKPSLNLFGHKKLLPVVL
jgi:transposase